jgi:hypothetical protein
MRELLAGIEEADGSAGIFARAKGALVQDDQFVRGNCHLERSISFANALPERRKVISMSGASNRSRRSKIAALVEKFLGGPAHFYLKETSTPE